MSDKSFRPITEPVTGSVLLLTAYFPPDTGSAAHLFYELGSELVKRGRRVTVVTGMPGYHAHGPLDCYRRRLFLREVMDGMSVVRVATPAWLRKSLIGRGISQATGAAMLMLAIAGLSRHDAAIVYSPPLLLARAAITVTNAKAMPLIVNVQDLFPRNAVDLGLLRKGFLIRLFEYIERSVYRRANHVIVHSEGNADHVIQNGADPTSVTVVPNWVDIQFIKPGERMNGFRKRYNLDDSFVATFAGVLGYSQDVDSILEAAYLTRDHPHVRWLIVGDGAEKPRLLRKAKRMNLPNTVFLPMLPRTEYPSLLQASDAGLVTLRNRVRTPVVPSKIMSLMAAGIPIVASVPESDAAALIHKSSCGVVVAPEDPTALAEAVLNLAANPDYGRSLAKHGRVYAERFLSVEHAGSLYDRILKQFEPLRV